MPKFKKSSGFRMKGYSYPGTSPMKQGDQPYTKEKSQKIEREKGILEDRISLTAAQNKAIAEQRDLHKAGKINTKQLNKAIAEIKTYVDY